MLRKLHPRSVYDVLAVLALFAALGGGALAATGGGQMMESASGPAAHPIRAVDAKRRRVRRRTAMVRRDFSIPWPAHGSALSGMARLRDGRAPRP